MKSYEEFVVKFKEKVNYKKVEEYFKKVLNIFKELNVDDDVLCIMKLLKDVWKKWNEMKKVLFDDVLYNRIFYSLGVGKNMYIL